jgi:uncharacterized protein YxjI
MSLEFDRLSEQAALIRHYKIKYKLFSQKKFAIYNEHNLCLYTFRSYFAAGAKLTMIKEATGKEIVKIRQQLGHLHLRFDIYAGDENNGQLASIQQTGLFSNRKLMINSVFGEYQVNRQGRSHEYILIKGEQMVAQIKEKGLANIYLVDVA